ncbi:protein-tyrosine-phosphatase [Chryseobacterium taklimakanense]|uniref:arsenate-mycothiol transferase ArsC n=1 Tax=Chryseobacterium taklimakanense TaxID=536441 RepID=UPI001EF64358|nr:protein-tyrosine-phosphatase [Chryseobacterium taklimakanense]MCG7280869.1 protein-tyrosine-phosphatase [Chryseobacterium taklimakanense]
MKTEIVEIISGFQKNKISEERKQVLQPLIDYIREKRTHKEKIRLNFICTHNSRRSHLSQIWAQTMAHYFRIDNVECFSGGTEATAMFPKVAETLAKQGFEITKLSENQNPVYAIKFDKDEMPVVGFSKKYDDPFNPESGFCAVMTCSSADQGCPFIAGADKRIPVRYEDPKMYDGNAEMDEKYLQKSLEIGQEMFYVFSKVAE